MFSLTELEGINRVYWEVRKWRYGQVDGQNKLFILCAKNFCVFNMKFLLVPIGWNQKLGAVTEKYIIVISFHHNHPFYWSYVKYCNTVLYFLFPSFKSVCVCVCVKMSSSLGNYSLPNCSHSTGADELWIQLWLADMKISPDLAGGDYTGSLPQRGATARSMPCNPVRPISPIRIHGPTDGALGWMCWVPAAAHTHCSAWVSREVWDARVSGFR